jgi:DUF4097 and DUF4098 domain-containing protein YvlB
MTRTLRICALAVLASCLPAGVSTAGKTREIERTIKADPGQKIEIRGFSGSSIRFSSWDKPEISIRVKVSVSASDESVEQRLLDSMRVNEEHSGNDLLVTFDDPGMSAGGKHSFWEGLKSLIGGNRSLSRDIRGEIRVPAANDLSASMPYADVQLEGMKGKVNFRGTSNSVELRNCAALQRVENDYGKTKILKSGGSLDLRSQSGTVDIDEFDGDVTCHAPYSKIRISRVARAVSVEGQSGSLNISDVKGALTIDADYSPITIAGVAGMTDVKSQSATLRITNVDGARVSSNYSRIDIAGVTGKAGKELVVESQSGTLSIEDAVGDLKIDNPYSRMTLKNIKGNVKVSGQSVTINAEGVTGDWDSDNQYSNIDVRGLAARNVRAENSSGNLNFELTVVPDQVTIKNQYSGVAVTMPKGFSGDVTLDAEYGSVDTSFPLKIRSATGSTLATGKIGSGSGSILIETTSGKIKLRER